MKPLKESEIIISDDKFLLDLNIIYNFLTICYWSEGISKEIVRKSIDGSMCFGVYKENKQIGFGRVITDKATFAYLADVFIIEGCRGLGYSKQLINFILKHTDLQNLKRFMLATKDAHRLYNQFGFSELTFTDRWMHIHKPDLYKGNKNVM